MMKQRMDNNLKHLEDIMEKRMDNNVKDLKDMMDKTLSVSQSKNSQTDEIKERLKAETLIIVS